MPVKAGERSVVGTLALDEKRTLLHAKLLEVLGVRIHVVAHHYAACRLAALSHGLSWVPLDGALSFDRVSLARGSVGSRPGFSAHSTPPHTTPHRNLPYRTAPHLRPAPPRRTSPHHTAPHRTAPHSTTPRPPLLARSSFLPFHAASRSFDDVLLCALKHQLEQPRIGPLRAHFPPLRRSITSKDTRYQHPAFLCPWTRGL
jgi:hypothetical protein